MEQLLYLETKQHSGDIFCFFIKKFFFSVVVLIISLSSITIFIKSAKVTCE